jgi:REP element-mobilizing transposase RayT
MSDIYKEIEEFKKTRRNLPHWQSPGSTYFVTSRSNNRIFSESEKDIIFSAIKFLDKKKYFLYAVVVMPDHIHILFQPIAKKSSGSSFSYFSLLEIMHSIKSFTAHQIGGAVWQHESYDRIIRNEQEFYEKMFYIVNNPVRAEIVKESSEYKWLYYSIQ